MFQRSLGQVLIERCKQFPVVALMGPRQSGKTTLLKTLDSRVYHYINLELPSMAEQIRLDPLAVLEQAKSKKLILDEVQSYPEIFSYIQVWVDESQERGAFILSGSQNFLLNKHVSQSLAGRVALLELLPLTFAEYQTYPAMPTLSLWQWLYLGGYPRPHHTEIPVAVWLENYIKTYLERDVRDLLKVRDLNLFQRFLRLCAGRHGQLCNNHQLAIDCGVSHTTIQQWLSILEASYIIFRLFPYHENFSKRVVKTPKLYFYDSGLVSYLLGIDSAEHLSIHASRGAIFEGYVISEIKRFFLNQGLSQPLYFWRDSNGNEVDCLFEQRGQVKVFEIKSSMTFRQDLMRGLKKWCNLTGNSLTQCKLIYAGKESQTLLGCDVVAWHDINQIFET